MGNKSWLDLRLLSLLLLFCFSYSLLICDNYKKLPIEEDPYAYYYKAVNAYSQRNFKEGIEQINKALEFSDNVEQSIDISLFYYYKSRCLLGIGEESDALKNIKSAVIITPENNFLQLIRLLILYKIDNHLKEEGYGKLSELNDVNNYGYVLKGYFLSILDRRDLGVSEIYKCINSTPSAIHKLLGYYTLAWIYLENEDYVDSFKMIEEVESLFKIAKKYISLQTMLIDYSLFFRKIPFHDDKIFNIDISIFEDNFRKKNRSNQRGT